MSLPYLSEIRTFAFGFAPKGWAMCNGQLLSIQQNTALFSLLGTTYGGNGTTTFALPNLQGAVPLGCGNSPSGTYNIGQIGGEANHTLLTTEIPQHTHAVQASDSIATEGAIGVNPGPTVVLAQAQAAVNQQAVPVSAYSQGAPSLTLASNALGFVGASQPHPNQQPYLVLNFCISLTGIYPSRS